MFKNIVVIVGVLSLISGCATHSTVQSDSPQMGNLLLAEPAPVNARSQMAIARYNQILAQAPLKDNERAELLYQRPGILIEQGGSFFKLICGEGISWCVVHVVSLLVVGVVVLQADEASVRIGRASDRSKS